MKKIFARLPFLLFAACGLNTADAEYNNSSDVTIECFDGDCTTPTPFWQSTGLLAPSDRNKNGTGFADIEVFDKWIFVANALKISQIFVSIQGTNTWDTIKPPDSIQPFKIYADSLGLLVGTYRKEEIWRYNPENKEWFNLNLPKTLPQINYNYLNVYGMGHYKGNLIVATAGWKDTTQAVAAVRELLPDGSWKDITPPYAPQPFEKADMEQPFHFFQAKEWRGKLFALTQSYGVWMYDGNAWSHIPNPPTAAWYKGEYRGGARMPRAMTIYKDRLYVGFYNAHGVFALQDSFNEWVSVDSIWQDAKGSITSGAPLDIWALAANEEYLFTAGGTSGIPAVYMGDRGEPKGWRNIDRDGWCPSNRFACIGLDTYDMAIIGDTLYALAWEGLYKFPISKLDSAIVKEKPYE